VRTTTSEVPAHRPYQSPRAARPTAPLDRSSQAAIAASTADEDTDEYPTPVRPVAAPPSAERPAAAPRRSSEVLEAEDAALLSPRTALLVLAAGALLLALWILR